MDKARNKVQTAAETLADAVKHAGQNAVNKTNHVAKGIDKPIVRVNPKTNNAGK